MTLSDWLSKKRLSDRAFAARILEKTGKRVSREAVQKWRLGQRIPRREHMVVINQATRGSVKSTDFNGV